MEQMPNLRLVATSADDVETRSAPWRSFGSVVSSLVARAEAQRTEAGETEAFRYAPVAWAAE